RPDAGGVQRGLPVHPGFGVPHPVPVSDTGARRRDRPARPGLPVGVARRVLLVADGADVHAARPRSGPRRRAGGATRRRGAGRRHLAAPGRSPPPRAGAVAVRISFTTANFVARETGYAMHGWGHGDRMTNAAFAPIETYPERIDALF